MNFKLIWNIIKNLKQLGAYCLFTFNSEPVHFHSLRKLALQKSHNFEGLFTSRVLPSPQEGRQEWEGAPEAVQQAGPDLLTSCSESVSLWPKLPTASEQSLDCCPTGSLLAQDHPSPDSLTQERPCRPALRGSRLLIHLSPWCDPWTCKEVSQTHCQRREWGFSADPGSRFWGRR